MQIMFLMGSQSVQNNREDYPIYLTEINQQLILEKQISYCKTLNPAKMLFCISHKEAKKFRVDAIIRQLVPDSEIILIQKPTKGAICTALLGSRFIDNDEELVLMAVDDFVEDPDQSILPYFRARQSDAGIVYLHSVHPRYSFVKIDDGYVTEAAEKLPISHHALASFYYFKKGQDFVACAKEVIRKDNPVNQAFYISQTLNELILRNQQISAYAIPNIRFHPLKTETQLAQYLSEINALEDSK